MVSPTASAAYRRARQKMIVANTVALPADQIFALPANELTTPIAWFGVLCYTLQIYF